MDLRNPRLQTQENKTMWKLVHTTPIECTMDDSGVYTVINRIEEPDTHKGYIGKRVSVRCDIMLSRQCPKMDGTVVNRDEPLISFQGSANDVRKYVIRWIKTYSGLPTLAQLSWEHASYIGWELHRAETDPNYIQD